MSQAGHLIDSLARAAGDAPDRGLGIFDSRGRHVERRTYAELWASTRQAAARWRGLGLEPGERVLVSLPTGFDWFDAWFGAMTAGAIPAALAPPAGMGVNEAYLERLWKLAELLDARAVVVGTTQADDVATRFAAHGIGAEVVTPEWLADTTPAANLTPASPQPEDLAFLQFTSGSTGLPRAVQIPHRAVLHNNAVSDVGIGAATGAARASDWADGMVSWLPLHHDMGLVGCLCLSVHLRHDLWLFNPTTFLARPKLWLQQLAANGQVFAPAPNFGYQLCVERIRRDDLSGLDLSGWRAALTGAEMVRTQTFEAFTELMAPTGFRRESVLPCYGLAEGTLAVTFDQRGLGLRTRAIPGEPTDAVACVGAPVLDTELAILAPDGQRLPDGAVGEVRARGPGIFTGYWNDPEATAESLVDGWLATGDLGFVHDGELYLTGRLKDILILRGENVMPHELEWQAEAVAGGGGSLRCGAFSVAHAEQGEQAVVVMETTHSDLDVLAEQEREIRNRVGRETGLVLADVMFVRRGKVPKTTSGKVQRRQLRQLYLDAKLDRLNVGGTTIHG